MFSKRIARYALHFMMFWFAWGVLFWVDMLFLAFIDGKQDSALGYLEMDTVLFTLGLLAGGSLLMGVVAVIFASHRKWWRTDIERKESSEMGWLDLLCPYACITGYNVFMLVLYGAEASVTLAIAVILWGGILSAAYSTFSNIMDSAKRRFFRGEFARTSVPRK